MLMPAANKSKVEISLEENRVTLIFPKILTKKELDTIYTDIRFAATDLKPGFNVISDFSQTKFLFLNALGVFREIFNFILSSDSGEIIRVIQDNRIIHKQLLNLSLRIPGYIPIYAPTIEEAKSKVKQPQRRNGLRFNLLQHPAEFFIDGTKNNGSFINISTSGSAIMSRKLQPEINSVVEIKFSLQDQKKQSNNFSIKARVVRAESYTFAVSFMDMDEASKKNLWNCIIASGS
jgi:PilZ domain-containing protein